MPWADRFVPSALVFIDVDAGVLVPERKFGEMRARAIPARYERCLVFLDRLERLGDVFRAFDAGGINLRPD